MQDIVLKQTKIVKLSCYKAVKFRADPKKAACPFGFEKIEPTCQNCKWLTITTARTSDGRAMLSDEKVGILPLGSDPKIVDAELVSKLAPMMINAPSVEAPAEKTVKELD